MSRRKPPLTERQVAWIAYVSHVPADVRLISSMEEMTDEALKVWLNIARQHVGLGWNPRDPHNDDWMQA